MNNNPFTVSSPEMMNAEEMLRLYVPLAEGYQIDDPGHVFVHGHRGCGKSMMLRLLAPDCKSIEFKKPLKELPYIGVYATIKSTDLDIAEFERIKEQHAGPVLAEHSLCLFLASKVLQSLRDHTLQLLQTQEASNCLKTFVIKYVFQRLRTPNDTTEITDPLTAAIDAIDAKYDEFIDYMRGLSLSEEYIPFTGKIVGYREFLFPLCSNITGLSCMPPGAPLYILLDDADNLNFLQTQTLNTWVSYRTGHKVSFKISTQLGYKHYRTISNQRIETPHDYSEVDISTIYTGSGSNRSYPNWVKDIVNKRLKEHGIETQAENFFPVSEDQEAAIKEIAENLKRDWEASGRGFRPGDDAFRYARPDYIKGLGASKQRSKYSYSGLDQLIHISSGIVRYFLDDAASMYAEERKLITQPQSQSNTLDVDQVVSIRPGVQDTVIRNSADALMIENLDKLVEEADIFDDSMSKNEFKRLRNLIQALGGIFQEILFSDRSERRVFSIALSDSPPDEIMRILKLGVRHGYLYNGTIGSKDGRWRTRLFVMTRRLAPIFKLDPTGFSGYLFVTSTLLQTAIENPVKAVREFKDNRLGTVVDEAQLKLELDA